MVVQELIIGGVGAVATVLSGWVSWFFARKKYNSEVDQTLITNMLASLDFYLKLSDDNKTRLEELAGINKQLLSEVHELRKQLLDLALNICLDLTCKNRLREGHILNRRKDGKNSYRVDWTESNCGGGPQPPGETRNTDSEE